MFRSISRMLATTAKSKIPFTVIVEGNIGSGKTTFLQHFEKYDNICVLSEPVEMWRDCAGYNIFAKFHENPTQWAFAFQSFVQLTMLQHHMVATPKPIKLLERSIFSARYCFVEKLFNDGILTPPSVSVLHEWFKYVTTNFNVPVDLIVYLQTSPEVSYQRVLARNRPEEKSITLQYVEEIHKMHENWLHHKTAFTCPAPVLTMNANLDRSTIEEEYEKCESRLLAMRV